MHQGAGFFLSAEKKLAILWEKFIAGSFFTMAELESYFYYRNICPSFLENDIAFVKGIVSRYF
jgi:hypothetical protein